MYICILYRLESKQGAKAATSEQNSSKIAKTGETVNDKIFSRERSVFYSDFDVLYEP